MPKFETLFSKYDRLVLFDTETTGNVTVRNRDTMQQDVVAIDNLVSYLEERIDF